MAWFNWKSKYDLAEETFNFLSCLKDFMGAGKHSPDLIQLIRYQIQLVFIPDEFQTGFPKNDLIKDCSVYLCKAETLSPFVVWKKNLGEESFPVPLKSKDGLFNAQAWSEPRRGSAGVVHGEIHAVKPLEFFPLVDKLKLNTVLFQRERVDLCVRYNYRSFSLRDGWHMSDDKMANVEAWMYIGRPEFWDEMPLSELGAVRMFIPNNKFNAPYYKFTKLEYDDL